MGDDAAKTARDAVLDQVKTAWDEYYKNETRAIDAEEEILQRVLKARGGANTLAKLNASRSKILLVNDINSFLTG